MILINVIRRLYHRVSTLPGWAALLFVCLSAWLAAHSWQAPAVSQKQRREKAWLTLGFGLLDALIIAALPHLGLSFGPVGVPLLGITGLRLVVTSGVNVTQWLHRSTTQRAIRQGQRVLLVAHSVILLCALEGMYVEPFRLTTGEVDVAGPALLPDRPLRIIHLSDLHVARTTKRETETLRRVEALDPDLIVLTGDYLNLSYTYDATAQRDARAFLAQLAAPYGVYAVTAEYVDPPAAEAALFDGLDITVLHDAVARVPLPGADLYIIGVDYHVTADDEPPTLARLMTEIPAGAPTLLLHHPPDLIEAAAHEGVDLYLAGHTHGGQIRVPIYGAIVTASAYGKRYEMGRYTVNETTLYVSRGLGMEGHGAPRARFLCPPEIVLVRWGPER